MTTEHEDDEPAIEAATEPAVEATPASITTQPDDGETEIATQVVGAETDPAVGGAADLAADSAVDFGDGGDSGDATSTAEFPAPVAAAAVTPDPAGNHDYATDGPSQAGSNLDGSSWTRRRNAVVAAVAVGAFAFGGVIGAAIGRGASDHDGSSRSEYGDEHADGDARNADGRDAGSSDTDSRDADSRDNNTDAGRGGGDRGRQQDGPTPNLEGAGGDQHGHRGRNGSGSGHGDR